LTILSSALFSQNSFAQLLLHVRIFIQIAKQIARRSFGDRVLRDVQKIRRIFSADLFCHMT